MAVTSGFFNSVNHDRLYDAEQISSMFDGIILDGIYQGLGDAFIVKPYSELNCTVTVGTGRAWFDHTWTLNSTELALTLDDPNVLYDRIDAIVIDVDRRQDVRANSIKVVKGTVSETGATKPNLIEEELHNQYPLAYVTVKAGSAAPIQAQYIENVIGQTKTPLVAGVLEHMDITMFVQQMEDEFNVWFEGLKDVVSGDSITNLQQQINDINENSIPMKKTLVDVMRNGVKESSKNFTISNGLVPEDKITSSAGSSNSTFNVISESEPNNQAIVLPDGSIARFGVQYCGFLHGSTGAGSYGNVGAFYRCYTIITSQNNVSNVYKSDTQYVAIGEVSDGGRLVMSNLVVYNVDADEYPVVVHAVARGSGSSYRYGSGDQYTYRNTFTGVIKITISNSSTVSYDISNTLSNSTGGSPSTSENAYGGYPAFLDDKSVLYADFHVYYNDTFLGKAFKISPEGVLQEGSLKTIKNNTIVMSGEGQWESGNIPTNQGYYVSGNAYSSFIMETRASGFRKNEARVNNSTLEITYPASDSVPSEYNYIREGVIRKLSSGNILVKKSASGTTKITTTNEGAYIYPAFSMGLSYVDSSNILLLFDYEDVKVGMILRSDNSSRSIYYDEEDKIGVYNILANKSFGNGISIGEEAALRNKYRIRNIGNSQIIVTDNAGTRSAYKTIEDTVSVLIVTTGGSN